MQYGMGLLAASVPGYCDIRRTIEPRVCVYPDFGKTKSLPKASLLSTLLFVLLHVPILMMSLKLQGMTLVLFS